MKLVVEILQVEQNTYQARCPALPGCIARGPTAEKALKRMRDKVLAYLSSLDVAEPRELELMPQE